MAARRIQLLVAATIACNVIETAVAVDPARAPTGTGEAEHSIPALALAALSLAVLPFLSAAQRKAGRELGSAGAVADSKQTLLCTYLSTVLLVGLLLNATLGWSWADPLGRPHRRPDHRRHRRQGRPRRLAGQGLLRRTRHIHSHRRQRIRRMRLPPRLRLLQLTHSRASPAIPSPVARPDQLRSQKELLTARQQPPPLS